LLRTAPILLVDWKKRTSRRRKLRVIIGDMHEKQMAKICRQGVAMLRKAEARGRSAKLIGLEDWTGGESL
jgi:hypothetical protein